MNIILVLLTYILAVIIVLLAIPHYKINLLKRVALINSVIVFIISLLLWVKFNANTIMFQNAFYSDYKMQIFNIYYSIGIDGISLYFIILSTFLIVICILSSWVSIKYRIKEFLIILFVIEWLLINVFSVLDLIFFYIFFEGILIPMFVLIGIWGSRKEKIEAAYNFFFYTLLGSVFMLLGILFIYSNLGSTDYVLVLNSPFSKARQIILWLCFFASFAVKVPMIPVHIWLPKAHVEAPTAGSVLLAGILLKLGTYGFLRFSIPLFPEATEYFTPLVYTLAVIAIIYSSLTTIRQIDLKRIIAYSSVAHMNFAIIGLFANNLQGLEGSLILMLSHGLVSSGLFLCVGFLYERYHTRIIRYYKGLIYIMPLFGICFLLLTLANIAMPGTSSFVGEFLILLGIFKTNMFVAVLAGTSMILGAVYSMWLYNRIMFDNYANTPVRITKYSDLNRREFLILAILIGISFLMGIYPNLFLDNIHLTISQYIR